MLDIQPATTQMEAVANQRPTEIEGDYQMATYRPATDYALLVAALADHRHDPIDPVNAIKIALGELADVWPDSIRPSTSELEAACLVGCDPAR